MTEAAPGKEKILEAALTEFAERGFDGARVDRIASEAGVNKALIYYHFKSKEELYVATLNDLFGKAAPKHVVLPEQLTVQQKIIMVTRFFVIFLHQNPLFVRMMDQAVYRGKDIFERVNEQNLFFHLMMALYEEGIAKGELRQVPDPVDYLFSLLGASYFYYSHRNAISKFYDNSLDEKAILETRLRTMEDLVRRVFFV
jgi:TetR/AcrR family transcriptional regulator